MENDPTLHQDQQNQSDQFIKVQGAKKANDFIKRDPVTDDRPMTEEEKTQQTKPEDFEKFKLDELEKLNE